jgi:hypothetical protein
LLDRPDADPNALEAQRWGVIAPEGGEGDEMLRALAPLLEHRARQQGAEVQRYRVPPDLDALRAVEWRDRVYKAEDVPAEERPRYLLMLGDLHQVSIELQHVLAQSAFVGRLHFATAAGALDVAGHAAYAEKVLAHERATVAAELPEVLLYGALDGSEATGLARDLLLEPCRKRVDERWLPKGRVGRLRVVLDDGSDPQALARAAGLTRSGVMLTTSHGVGAPVGGWASPEQQRAYQGALLLGSGRLLTPDEVRREPFLPGGMWFALACFGAATPPRSAFYPWLALLAEQQQYAGPVEAVRASLPPRERPFVAALPQAALANPNGPLAMVGHSDLAWSFGFTDLESPGTSRASRLLAALEVLAMGGRAGVALDALMRSYRDVNDSLTSAYQHRQEALADGQADPIEPRWLGLQWLLRNDLRGYMLLGDPAVRLPPRPTAG